MGSFTGGGGRKIPGADIQRHSMSVRVLAYDVAAWGTGEIWLDGVMVVNHELPAARPSRARRERHPLAERLRTAKRADGSPLYSTATGLALLAFFVLACQCMSTLAAIRRETKGWRWPAFVLAYTYLAGYVAAVIVYQLGRALGAG